MLLVWCVCIPFAGDTSSDESTGHVFALAATANLSPDPSERALATELLHNIVAGIVENNFELIDVTGNATTWPVIRP